MTDVHTKKQRSYNMSRIRGKNTKPEILLRKELWKRGFRYRLKNKLPGKPDIVFPKIKFAIFVDGCFWHKCSQHYKAPKDNAEFWEEKISKNVKRDQIVDAELFSLGWKIIRVWEHEIKKDLAAVILAIKELTVRSD